MCMKDSENGDSRMNGDYFLGDSQMNIKEDEKAKLIDVPVTMAIYLDKKCSEDLKKRIREYSGLISVIHL